MELHDDIIEDDVRRAIYDNTTRRERKLLGDYPDVRRLSYNEWRVESAKCGITFHRHDILSYTKARLAASDPARMVSVSAYELQDLLVHMKAIDARLRAGIDSGNDDIADAIAIIESMIAS